MRSMFAVKGAFVGTSASISSWVLSKIICCELRFRSLSLAVSASDDRTARLWDSRIRGEVGRLDDEFQITAVAYANDGQVVYTGGIDNSITAWDVRQMRRSMTMKGHLGTYQISHILFHPFTFRVVLCSTFICDRYHHMP